MSERRTLLPAFADDLEAAHTHAWALLVRGSQDSKSPFHTIAVGTAGNDGRARQRIVVLRAAETLARTLRFHTDIRSDKYAELRNDPRVSVLGYDPKAKIQLRLEGRAALHYRDDIAQMAWRDSRAMSRLCYAQATAPGSAIETPLAAPQLESIADGAGYENFAAVMITVQSLDWLFLEYSGHRRARFDYMGDATRAQWLAP